MEIGTIIPHIEALIFASEKPLTALELVEYVNNALGFIEDVAILDQVESAIDGIRAKYDSEFYAFELKQSGGGWQFLTKPQYHKTVALINGDKFMKKLSTASLETLSIIAYKQPVTKSEMESIRGVNCDYAVQKLLEKDLVIISGRNEDAVGKPLIYATSKSFMDYFGINSPNDLPKINEVLMQEYEKAATVTDIIAEQKEAQELEEEQHVPTPVEEAQEGLEEESIDRPETEIILDVEELKMGENFDTSALEEASEEQDEEDTTTSDQNDNVDNNSKELTGENSESENEVSYQNDISGLVETESDPENDNDIEGEEKPDDLAG